MQEALTKAYNSLGALSSQSNLRGWLFRIAHNKALDYLRHQCHQTMQPLDEYSLVAEPADVPLEEKELVRLALSVFLKLAPRQRSCVILKDVLGYSLAEISQLLNATVPEILAFHTRVAIINKGRLVVEGAVQELMVGEGRIRLEVSSPYSFFQT